jgi:hypothetical protein
VRSFTFDTGIQKARRHSSRTSSHCRIFLISTAILCTVVQTLWCTLSLQLPFSKDGCPIHFVHSPEPLPPFEETRTLKPIDGGRGTHTSPCHSSSSDAVDITRVLCDVPLGTGRRLRMRPRSFRERTLLQHGRTEPWKLSSGRWH